MLIGAALWFFVLKSGIHATLAGVLLAATIPLRTGEGAKRPLVALEHGLHPWINFIVLPIFGFANAGVSLAAVDAATFAHPVMLGVAGGLLLGKLFGVLGFSLAAIRLKLAHRPAGVTAAQLLGTALLCGIGFTMSLFITLLAFPDHPDLQMMAKIGVLIGSCLAGMLGYLVLRLIGRAVPPTH